MMSMVEIDNVSKQYLLGETKVDALRGVTLGFEEAEFAGLVGPSGSGKTTLLNILGCLDEPTSGSVRLFGHETAKMPEVEAARIRRNSIGFVFQSFNLLPVYTVRENIEFPLLLLKMPSEERRRRVQEALEWVGLTEKMNARPHQLSGGQAQRVAIARAIVKRSKLVLADEPTANLDSENSHRILETMLHLNQELKIAFIFATHDEKVIRCLRRRILFVDGAVVRDETGESYDRTRLPAVGSGAPKSAANTAAS